MARPFADVCAEIMTDPYRRRRVEREKAQIRRAHNRPHWKLVRFWDRLRSSLRSS